MVLKDLNTNQLIPGFPATCAAINNMPGAQVNNLLLTLGQQVQGRVAERRKRLRFAIGSPAQT